MKGFAFMMGFIVTIIILITTGVYVASVYSFKYMPSCFCSTFNDSEEKITTYPFDNAGKLLVTNSNGSVTITSHKHNMIILKEIKKGNKKDFDLIKTNIIALPDSFSITTVPDKKVINAKISYELTVPATTILQNIRTSNGQISIEGINGSIKTTTSNGAIQLTEINGIIDAQTSNGPIVVENCPHISTLKTSNGSIKIQSQKMGSVAQETTITTSNGAIDFTCNEFNEPNQFRLSTSNGAILVTLPEKPTNYQSNDHLMGKRATFTCGKATFIAQTNRGSLTIK